MKQVNAYLNFNGNTMEAFEFYRSVFGGEFLAVMRMRDLGVEAGYSDSELDLIAHVALPLDGMILMGTDAIESQGMTVRFGNNTYLMIEADDADEAERLFTDLSAGGTVQMALATVDWAEKYGSLVDQFGVQWMISFTGNAVFTPAG